MSESGGQPGLLTLAEAAALLGMKASGLRKIVKNTKLGRSGPQIQYFQIGSRGQIKFKREWVEVPDWHPISLDNLSEVWTIGFVEKRCPKCEHVNVLKSSSRITPKNIGHSKDGKRETVTCEKCGEFFWYDGRKRGKPPQQRFRDQGKRAKKRGS